MTLMLLATLTQGGCQSAGPTGVVPGPDAPQEDGCAIIVDELDKLQVDVSAGFDSAVATFDANAQVDRLKSIKSNFDAIQNDYQLMSRNLCRDQKSGAIDSASYARHRYCLDQQFMAMRAFDRTLSLVEKSNDPNHVTHLLESNNQWLASLQQCFDNARNAPDAFAGLTRGVEAHDTIKLQPDGCMTSNTGYVMGGAMRLVSNNGQIPLTCQKINLEAELTCERQTQPGVYSPVASCNGATLRQGDRFKVSVSTTQDANLYFFLSNSTGQFQMFFPTKDTSNRTRGGARYKLPQDNPNDPDRAWLYLDDVTNVIENIMIVAASAPIQELEEHRDINDPGGKGVFTQKAQGIRGRIEPIASRGGRIEPIASRGRRIEPIASRGRRIEPIASRGADYQGGTMLLAAEDNNVQLDSRITTDGFDAVAVEFTIQHK